MIAAWMLYCTGVALLLGAAGHALERACRWLGRPGRGVWLCALLVTFGLPVAARLRPTAFGGIAVPMAMAPAGAPLAPESTATPGSRFSWADLDRPLALLWGGLSLGLLAFGVVAAVRLQRLQRSWRLANVDGTPVLVSRDHGPAVVGLARGRLVVPAWTLELGPRQLELLLAHEQEHLRAADPRTLALSGLLLALMPWNPGVWWQWRRLRLAVEMDCDARVLRRNPDRARYGNLLLEVSGRAAHRLSMVTAFHEPMSFLERRIRAIASRPSPSLARGVVGATAATLLVIAACEAPRPTAPASTAAAEQAGDTVTIRALRDPRTMVSESVPAIPDSVVHVYALPRVALSVRDTALERPMLLAWAPPAYPPLLLQAGIQGVVTVEAVIATTGRAEPNSVKIVESTHPAFNASVKRAMLVSLWRPARVDGKPVRMLIKQAVTFGGEPTRRP